MSHTYIAYVRVSTTKQFIQGVSIAEQRRAITKYSAEHHFNIVEWYEEIQSAAKGRRPVFSEVIKILKQRHYGLIMHKIDRGARNLRDWADIGDLIDAGIEVRFAHDNLDLDTRGGRLTADIQAVIAADYIRNLREEVRKGIQGRLQQGIYPFRAPRGYLNRGGGRVKIPDPIYAPLIVTAFHRYATGAYTLKKLTDELLIIGLSNPNGNKLTPSTLSRIFRCHFYVGEYRVRGVTYQGLHQPLISRDLFNSVQRMLSLRKHSKHLKYAFRYRRQLKCQTCQHHLIGERQKGRTYYRCHNCPRVSVREDRVPALVGREDSTFTVVTEIKPELTPFDQFGSL
ncbi:hypothetical protein NTGHW29_130035 [Candidatus Nitrotoga sp. HW29]|uniref:recombinase family protein n=1 Tax=Candidatus Nitrotoga sp. HW29 TaxID=2886963 RepID=UPI001EF1E0F9|nr:recombinase family protein [Candidatus Nitrotoga sp. HW29]CAH1903574.1 hypothetical protein NTGHW29_130035 [Candidatus Nitrotoga sp. HW29]